MKQLLQDLSTGETTILEAPVPSAKPGKLIINSTLSLISVGTERMLVDFGKANLLDKARQQPDKVKQVLEKTRTDGVLTTVEAVRSKLAQPIPLGYSNVGVVADVGAGVTDFKVGDRVVSNGPHADVVRVPTNLCARIPDGVTDEAAAFTVVSSIGLQGIRLAQPTLGETFVVTGAGLIGLLTIQMLQANGCRVLAIDLDTQKLALAEQFGAETCNIGLGEDPVAAGMAFSGGRGVDGVIITASTKSNDPVTQAAQMSRKRGRIILVGVVGLTFSRADFYKKELTFQVSCSYGPGRYDPSYEEQGRDYPLGFVRWTEQRNFEAVLGLMADQRLETDTLMTHRFKFEQAREAYDTLSTQHDVLGVLLSYDSPVELRHQSMVQLASAHSFTPIKPIISFIGAGNYASRVLIPAFKQAGAQLHTIVTSGSTNGVFHGKNAGFIQASNDVNDALTDSTTNTVVIATRHNTHAPFVAQALQADKHVFVEKPLTLTQTGLDEVKQAYEQAYQDGHRPQLMVGYNRRFSPLTVKMKELLSSTAEPKTFMMTMNVGAIPSSHWTQDIEVGGGRVIGEACHYIDLMRFLAGHKIVSVQARRMGDSPGVAVVEDKAAIILGFEDGSFGTIHYLANGSKAFPKERIEVFVAERVLQIDNFSQLRGYSWPKFNKLGLWKQDKGQQACPLAFLNAIEQGKPAPIAADEIFEVAQITLDVAEILRNQ